MKSIFVLAAFLALSFSAPVSGASPPNLSNTLHVQDQQIATVKIRFLEETFQGNDNNQQVPTNHQDDDIAIKVGQVLSRDTNPIMARAVEIVGITEGKALGGNGQKVENNDRKVVCRARKNNTSKMVEFTIEDGMRVLSDGQPLKVSGLECALKKK